MLAASRRPFNPNRSTTDVTGWDSGDLSSFLTGVNINGKTLLINDTKLSNKPINYYQSAPKNELVAEIIATFNYNQLKLLNGIGHIQTCNDRLLCITKNRNKTIIQLTKQIKYLHVKMNTISLSLIKATHSIPEFKMNQINTTETISSINDDSNHLVIEGNLNTNTIHTQTLYANPRLFNSAKKVNKSININKKNNNNSIAKNIVKPPSADLPVSDLNKINIELSTPSNNPLHNTSHDKQIILINNKPQKIKKLSIKKPKKSIISNKRKKNKNKSNIKNNKSKNIKTHCKRQQKHQKSAPKTQIIKTELSDKNHTFTETNHASNIISNECTSMIIPYKPNKQRKKRYTIINPIRNDIDIKTRYGIYHNSKCLESQLQDILPYEEYLKDEQQAYDELNEQINYAVFNR